MEPEITWRNQQPAKQTCEYMEKTTDKFNHFEITMMEVKNDIKLLSQSIESSNEINTQQHKDILRRLSRLEMFALGTLIIFALAALYLIFDSVGLPH